MLQGNCKYEIKGNQLIMEAEPKTDFFVNPIDGSVAANAQFVYEEMTGDFVCKAKISLEHKAMFDAGVLFAMADETHWAKACFELGDYGFKSVCTVMTDGLSDDCNNVTVEGSEIWLQLSRTGNAFAVHYSLDGEKFYMARLCSMTFGPVMKVGFVAQSPTGEGGTRTFTDFSVESRTLENPRLGA